MQASIDSIRSRAEELLHNSRVHQDNEMDLEDDDVDNQEDPATPSDVEHSLLRDSSADSVSVAPQESLMSETGQRHHRQQQQLQQQCHSSALSSDILNMPGINRRSPSDAGSSSSSSSSEEVSGVNGAVTTKERTYRCRHCSFQVQNKIEFWRHARGHIKPDKMLECKDCEFVTEYRHHLEYHQRNHSNEKPFQCDKCSYRCVNRSMLNSHLKSHSSMCHYRCQDCTYATKYCHSLKTHLRKNGHRSAGTTAHGLSSLGKQQQQHLRQQQQERQQERPVQAQPGTTRLSPAKPSHAMPHPLRMPMAVPASLQQPLLQPSQSLLSQSSPLHAAAAGLPWPLPPPPPPPNPFFGANHAVAAATAAAAGGAPSDANYLLYLRRQAIMAAVAAAAATAAFRQSPTTVPHAPLPPYYFPEMGMGHVPTAAPGPGFLPAALPALPPLPLLPPAAAQLPPMQSFGWHQQQQYPFFEHPPVQQQQQQQQQPMPTPAPLSATKPRPPPRAAPLSPPLQSIVATPVASGPLDLRVEKRQKLAAAAQ